MKKLINAIIVLTLVLGIGACDDSSREKVELSGDVSILSFKVNGIEAEIDDVARTIDLMMPPGTNLTNLAPVVELPQGATSIPAPNTEVDFSNSGVSPVLYRVFNNDFYETYKVKIKEIKATINLFKVGNFIGEIDEKNRKITLFVTEGTDVSNVIPEISYTEGAIMSPAEGEALDLSAPIQITLSYAGTQFVYTVEVVYGAAPGLVIFNGEDVNPVWASLAAKVESPYANPQTDGINPSPYCASIIKNGEDSDDGGKPWSGGALWGGYQVNIDPAEYSHFTMLVLKEVQGDVQLEIQADGEQDKDFLKAWYSEEDLGKWVKLTFTIPEGRTAPINNILVGPHAHDAGQPVPFSTHRVYWDDLIAHPR